MDRARLGLIKIEDHPERLQRYSVFESVYILVGALDMSSVRRGKSKYTKRSTADINSLLGKLATGEVVVCGGSMFTDEENNILLRAALGVV